MSARIKRILIVLLEVWIALAILVGVYSWGWWNRSQQVTAPVTVVAPAPPVSTPAPAPAPAPVSEVIEPQKVIVNPPAVVNVTVSQTVNGIETSVPTPAPIPTPTPTAKPVVEVMKGDFKGIVYDSEGWYVGKFKELTIDHLWGSGGPINRTDNFRVTWEGSFSVATAGIYSFKVVADGGVQLFVDDYLIIDKKSLASQSVLEHEGSVNLTAGQHEVVLKYYETTGDATVRLLYGKN